MKPSSSNEIELRSYTDQIQADMEKELLEKEGIKCYLKNANISSANWLYTNAVGGITLIVGKPDLEKAKEILSVFEQETPENIEIQPKCPNCKSEDVRIVNPRWFLGLLFILILGLGMPSPFRKRNYRCNLCGQRWEIEQSKDQE